MNYEELLDQHEPAINAPVDLPNEGWFFKVDQQPVFRLADSWGGHTDLPLGLDLQEVA